jgi:hypothetical protein
VFSIVRSKFLMYSVTAIFRSSNLYCNHQVHGDFLITLYIIYIYIYMYIYIYICIYAYMYSIVINGKSYLCTPNEVYWEMEA